MANHKTFTLPPKQRSILDQLTLTYYNNLLLEKGMITEREHELMRSKIQRRRRSTGVER